MEDFTRRLFPTTFWQVSFRYDTTSGHTPMMLGTTLTRPGIDKALVMMAFRNAGLDAIQSRVSASHKRLTTNSVFENCSGLPNTNAANRRRQGLNNWRPNVGYSTSLAWYALPKYLAKASVRTCDLPCSDTIDTARSTASRIFHRIVAVRFALMLTWLTTATQTRRNVDFSHIRTISKVCVPRSSNSMLQCPCDFTQPNTQEKMRGYIPFNMID